MDLSPKQRAFCHEYLFDYNATQAAIRAGYSPKSARNTGYTLVHNPVTRDYIASLIEQHNQRSLVSKDFIVDSLVAIVNRTITPEPVRIWDNKEKCWKETGDFKIDGPTAIKAIESLSKHLNLSSQKQGPPQLVPVKASEHFDHLLELRKKNLAWREHLKNNPMG